MMRGAPVFVALLLAAAICIVAGRIGLVAIAAVLLAVVLEDWAAAEDAAKRREERDRFDS